MGGRPSKGTPADRRLKTNTGTSSSGKPAKQTGKPLGAMPMKPPHGKPMAAPRRGTPKHH